MVQGIYGSFAIIVRQDTWYFCIKFMCTYVFLFCVYVCHFKQKLNKNRFTQLCNFKIKRKGYVVQCRGSLARFSAYVDVRLRKKLGIEY